MGLTGYMELSMDDVAALMDKAQTAYSYDGGGFFIKHLIHQGETVSEEIKSILFACTGGVNLLVRVNEFPQIS